MRSSSARRCAPRTTAARTAAVASAQATPSRQAPRRRPGASGSRCAGARVDRVVGRTAVTRVGRGRAPPSTAPGARSHRAPPRPQTRATHLDAISAIASQACSPGSIGGSLAASRRRLRSRVRLCRHPSWRRSSTGGRRKRSARPVERAQDERRDVLLELGAGHEPTPVSPRSAASRESPRRTRVFTVPSGSPRRSAIWLWERPSK